MTASREPTRPDDDLGPLCSLEDDTRRRLYEVVVAAGEPVSRDQAGTAAGVDRSLAAYHLDKLVAEGLLAASFARPPGRGGPGAGRPAKHYRRSDREFTVSLPPRDYELAAGVFARAAEDDPSGTVRRALQRAATQAGRELAAAEGEGIALIDHLRRQGFEPYDDDGVIRLRNCPFHHLARRHTELVCGMNLAMLSGLVEALAAGARPRLDPAPGRCCVALDP
jgi:predicted ArsR family transcriptional regulator